MPALRAEWVGGGLLVMSADDMDVAAVHRGWLRKAKRAGPGWCWMPAASPASGTTARGMSACGRARPRSAVGAAGPAPHCVHPAGADQAQPSRLADGDQRRRVVVLQARRGPVAAVVRQRRPDPPCKAAPEARDIGIAIGVGTGIGSASAASKPWRRRRSNASLTAGQACRASSPITTRRPAVTPSSKAASGWPGRAARQPDGTGPGAGGSGAAAGAADSGRPARARREGCRSVIGTTCAAACRVNRR